MTTVDTWELLTRKDDLAVREVRPAPRQRLADGQVLLAVEKFSMTMNTITYTRMGASELPFWEAFPSPDGYGRTPVWGFVRVEDSRHPDITAGERYYGWVTAATHHVVTPERTTRGFVDTAQHIAFMPTWYRTFQRVAEPDGLDDRRVVYRQIFPASFNLADFLVGQAAGGAKSVLVTSASSKTAIGLAEELIARRARLPVNAVTSARNVDFVRALGCYDTVSSYTDLTTASVYAPAVFVDFTGEHRKMAAVYDRFPGELAHTALVGYTHPLSEQQPPPLTEPEPEIFFTPIVEEQAAAEEGEERFYTRYHAAEDRFLTSTERWLTVHRHSGPDAIVAGFNALLDGPQPPDETHVFTP
ncbi:hypothetical protein BLA60_33640 [Actinophytocola xinjiangensis]|uniref:DUF2855 family protein n=1 Tax=Actinophytocola xinjiangensis TaxID=485602 RepID=A0A7Z0WG53_9PSEU|nr:DUF2855 family protein [Actinophytocola xinjiangensis]OLF05998.1 hypothetical protein BLA60_33640 [Actinophytocola xinjiangensis]